MRPLPVILAVGLASCGADRPIEDCNFSDVDVEVVNRSQFTIDALEIGEQSVLASPLEVGQTVVVTGFAYAEDVSFVRQRPDQRDALRIRSESSICVRESERLVLFDQSFRVEDL